MKLWLVLAALLIESHGAAGDAPEMLPPWIVAESPLRPDLRPVRASAVLSDDGWFARDVGTLAQAFREIPGASLLESFGGFEPPRISIRGSGLQSAPSSRGVALLLDALPLGLADGSFNSALIDPLLGRRLEVQRGLDGWRSAPSAAGGAIDVRSGNARENAGSIRAEGGAFGAFRARAQATVSRGPAAAGAALSLARQTGFREHNGQARAIALVRAEFGAADHARLAFDLYRADARYDVPGPLTLATALAAPRSVSAEVRRDLPQRVSAITRVSARVRRSDADSEWEFGTALARTTDDFRQLQANGVTRSSSDDAHVRAGYSRRFLLGNSAHQLRIAGTASRGWRDLQRFANERGHAGAPFARDGLFPTTTTINLEDAFSVAPRVVATAGVARVASRRDIADRLPGAMQPEQRFSDDATLPAVSIRWRVENDTVVFAAMADVAEPPTFDDLSVVGGTAPALLRQNRRLETQRVRTWEAGVRRDRGGLAWEVTAYRADWRNEILRLADALGSPRGSVNASPTTHEGLECSARWIILAEPLRVSLAGTAVWTRCVFDADPLLGRNRLAGLPPHAGTAELTVDFPRHTFFAVAADWTAGRTPVDHAGRLAYGGSTRLTARAGWRQRQRGAFFVEVQNVLDRPAIASTAGVLDLARNPSGTSVFLPAPGRAVTCGFEWRH
jgi:iron complex outermembrane receptor protein